MNEHAALGYLQTDANPLIRAIEAGGAIMRSEEAFRLYSVALIAALLLVSVMVVWRILAGATAENAPEHDVRRRLAHRFTGLMIWGFGVPSLALFGGIAAYVGLIGGAPVFVDVANGQAMAAPGLGAIGLFVTAQLVQAALLDIFHIYASFGATLSVHPEATAFGALVIAYRLTIALSTLGLLYLLWRSTRILSRSVAASKSQHA